MSLFLIITFIQILAFPKKAFFMIFSKQATTIDFQISQLRQRGLIISNERFAKKVLSRISYYRLAGYWWPLQSDKVNHKFKPNSKFETVLKIYNFDTELRKLIFDITEEIEVAFRTKMIYHLSHEYTPWWFEDSVNFSNQKDYQKTIDQIKKDLGLNRSKEVFLSEHYKKYHLDSRCPPAWKTLEVLSFGSLSKMYGNLSNSCSSKDRIADELGTVNHTYLHSWIQDICQIRNICAHHGRIWNKNLPGRPKMLSRPPLPWLTKVPPVTQHEKLYIHLCCMKYITNIINPNNNYTYRLYVLLKKYPNIDLNALGMPKDWYKEPLWRNKISVKNPLNLMLHKFVYVIRNRITS